MSIPTPPDLARGRVSWTLGRAPDGTTLPGARGTVRFEATAVAVNYSSATVLPEPVEKPVTAGVMTPADLLVNDPEVWNWEVTPRLGVTWPAFHIDVDGPVDLATAAAVPGKGPIRAVKGPKGDRGDITATELAPGTDADTLTAPGIYYESNSSQAGPNFPGALAGVFTVTADPTSLHVHQRFISFGSAAPRQWFRSRYDGAWSPWRLLVTSDDPRLTDARTPTAHTHAVDDVAGLAAAIAGGRYDLGDIPSGTDLNGLHDTKHYAVRTATIANTLTNWPAHLAGWPGHLEVMGASNGMTVQRVTGYGSRFSLWTRAVASVNSGSWTDWEQIWPAPVTPTTGWDKGDIPNGTDMNTLTTAGLYGVRSATVVGTLLNAPADALPGTVEVLTTSNGIRVQRWTYYGSSQGMRLRTTQSVTSGSWTAWADPWTPGTPPAPADTGLAPYAAHSIRQMQMMYAMGGPIDTGGLGAVAWRIDHGWKNFKEKLLPIFRAAGIVPMVTYNPRDWSRSENAGVTAAEVNQWVADGWIEISNHGGTHGGGPTGETAIHDNIVNGLAEIEAELPAAKGKVWGWCQPGGSAGPYDGFLTGSTPQQWDTYAGRLIMQHHAVGYGYSSGTHLRILDGTIRDGLSHQTLDSYPVASTKTRINQAVTQRRGLQVMLHPSLVDEPGYITTADIQEVVDYIVARRTAGDLVTLSPYQMMVADSTRVSTQGAADLRDTGWIDVIPDGPAVDPAEPGVVRFRRVEDQVFCRVVGVAILPGASNAWLLPNAIPTGFTLGGVGQVADVPGGFGNGALQPNRAVRHRLSIQENDLAYVGYIHNWNGVTVEPAREDGTRRIYGTLPAWITDDPYPA